MVWLLDREKSLRICLAVYTEYRRVTDRQTSCHSTVRAMYTRRAVNSLSRTLTVCLRKRWPSDLLVSFCARTI